MMMMMMMMSQVLNISPDHLGWSSIQGKVQRFQPGRAIRTKGAEIFDGQCVCV